LILPNPRGEKYVQRSGYFVEVKQTVRSGDSSSSSSKRTAAVADVGSDEEEDSELDDQDDESYVDDSIEGDK